MIQSFIGRMLIRMLVKDAIKYGLSGGGTQINETTTTTKTAKACETDLEATKKVLFELQKGVPQVQLRAMNKTVVGVKTDMVAIAREDYTYKADAVRKRMTVNYASYTHLKASVVGRGAGVPLTDFLGTNETQKGITVNIRKSTGRQLIPRTFKATVKSGKEIILRRPGNPRGQHATLYGRYGPPGSGGKFGSSARLDVFYGPHPEIIWNTNENWETLKTKADERLKVNYAHELDYLLNQHK